MTTATILLDLGLAAATTALVTTRVMEPQLEL
jgi:hypothetical protein